jgi:LmbE family N-acetylglucosaminyl deacetylase
MRILYIFPHPDDESFGPARAIAAQTRTGHQVSLLTLTRGGATKIRHRFGYSIAQMGAVRHAEMLQVEKVLGLTHLTVLDFPDSGLKELDPRRIERAVSQHVERLRPEIVVTYPVHGISRFHDHLVTHAVVVRVYLQLQDAGMKDLLRLGFVTLTEEQSERASGVHQLSASRTDEIDCLMQVTEADMDTFRRSLDCYVSYRETIEETGVRRTLDHLVAFEIFQESHAPPLDDLTAGL